MIAREYQVFCDDAFNSFLAFGYVLLDQLFGEDAFDLGLPPICIVIDEIAILPTQLVRGVFGGHVESLVSLSPAGQRQSLLRHSEWMTGEGSCDLRFLRSNSSGR